MNVNLHISTVELRELCTAALNSDVLGAACVAAEILDALNNDPVKDGDTIDLVF